MSVSPSPTPEETQQILAQYRGLWVALPKASRADAAARRKVLAAYAADPALRSLVAGIAAKRDQGQWYYGANLPRPTVASTSVSRGVAVIDDCQDSSHAGLSSVRTGQPITVGVARNHVVATLHRMDDGVWRVVFISYPKTPC